MTTFAELHIRPDILQGLAALGFTTPTPIQEEAIPVILRRQDDLISLAQTGTGKTAAFGIPLIQITDVASDQTQALILCPTRELCMQVARDLTAIGKFVRGLKVLPVYGGARIDLQIKALRQGMHIIVATPGRLLDLLKRRCVRIAGVTTVVLDEADEMLNMGFQEELNAILAETPATKKTLLFSATMPRAVVTITRKYMTVPVELTVGTRNAGADNIQHAYYMVHAKDRYAALKRLVDFNPDFYGIIFCRTRLDTQEVAEKLMQDGYRAEALHGDLSQIQRDRIMNKFRRKQVDILVATDVAARGLDVSDLTHVINYSLPDELSGYTHRSGRTGRAGKAGTSIAIIHMREKYRIRELERNLGKTFTYRRVPSGQEVCAKLLQQRIDTMLNLEVDHALLGPMLPALVEKLADLKRDELIKRFISLNFDRFLQYYKNAPDLNEREVERHAAPPPGRPKEGSRGKRDFRDENFTRFAINLGKKDGILPARLIAIINEGTRVRNIAIGKIVISEHNTLLDADSRYAPAILKAFDRLMIHGKPVKIEMVQASKPQPAPKVGRRYVATPRPTVAPKKYKKKAAAD